MSECLCQHRFLLKSPEVVLDTILEIEMRFSIHGKFKQSICRRFANKIQSIHEKWSIGTCQHQYWNFIMGKQSNGALDCLWNTSTGRVVEEQYLIYLRHTFCWKYKYIIVLDHKISTQTWYIFNFTMHSMWRNSTLSISHCNYTCIMNAQL